MNSKRDDAVCFLCDYWWLFLILLVVVLGTVFTRPYWMPIIFPQKVEIPTVVAPAEADMGTGDIQVTIHWQGKNDLDLHVIDPAGEEIFYSHKESASNGKLDVDANAACGTQMDRPVENIFWPDGGAPSGNYKVLVNYYENCGDPMETAYVIELKVDGKSQAFQGQVSTVGETKPIYSFDR